MDKALEVAQRTSLLDETVSSSLMEIKRIKEKRRNTEILSNNFDPETLRRQVHDIMSEKSSLNGKVSISTSSRDNILNRTPQLRSEKPFPVNRAIQSSVKKSSVNKFNGKLYV